MLVYKYSFVLNNKMAELGKRKRDTTDTTDTNANKRRKYYHYDTQFQEEDWYKDLSENDKCRVTKKMNYLQHNKIPNVYEIISLDVDNDIIRELLMLEKNLKTHDKLSDEFHAACIVLESKYRYYQKQSHKSNKKLEKDIIRNIQPEKSVKYQILKSDLDTETKTRIYKKYLTSVDLIKKERMEYTEWIRYVLNLPRHPMTFQGDGNVENLIKNMKEHLDKTVYGLTNEKNDLVHIVANAMANPDTNHRVIGLIGPNGVGKKKLMQEISKIINLPMQIINIEDIDTLGTLHGIALDDLKPKPSIVTSAVNASGYSNSILFIDETDRIHEKNLSRELEKILFKISDYTQNAEYSDKYLDDITLDLSGHLFVYSIENQTKYKTKLLESMNLIHLCGYKHDEKIELAQKYIIPELLDKYHLPVDKIIFPQETIQYLLSKYKEKEENDGLSGVHELKKILNTAVKKISLYWQLSHAGVKDVPQFDNKYIVSINEIKKILNEKTVNSSYLSLYH